MGYRAHRDLPRVSHVGARGESERGHVCGNCRQPGTNSGVESCRNNKPTPVESVSIDEEPQRWWTTKGHECPAASCEKPNHDVCWREYERDTDASKYRGL